MRYFDRCLKIIWNCYAMSNDGHFQALSLRNDIPVKYKINAFE